MKKVIFTIIVASFIMGCNRVAPVKTIENLNAAFIGESTASARYEAFARIAADAGNTAVAVLFKAASKSEAIHAGNHKKVLEGLGQVVKPVNPEITTADVLANLNTALSGESYEVSTMYPGFIASAKNENVKKAVKSFNWAFDTEKKHQVFYAAAIKAITDSTETSLPEGYAICPVCGNTYDVSAMDEKCAFCQTPNKEFIIVK
ncbi:MAG: rubrerythrin family protein [Chloroflexota bacterium]|nr:ferritin family protein [Bacteroidales bacterium]HLO92295.1 ferritin family protein [Lentimicrobium sp.]